MPSLADALAERLLQRLPPDRAYDRAALAEAARGGTPPLPRTVRHFLERMMMRRVEIERERLRVLRQPWLDHEHDEVQDAEKALLEAVRRHVRIPAEAWERVLRHACSRVAAHLVRPAPTLEDFVFGGTPAGPDQPASEGGLDLLPARVVLRRLRYFAAYPYLYEAVRAYTEGRDVASFQREHLGTFLRRVDGQMCSNHDTESWLRLLQPLFALGRAAHPNHDGLPTRLLESFFEEKEADLPLRRLRAARTQHDLAALSPSALAEILSPVGPSASPAPAETPPAGEGPSAPADDSATPPSEEAPPWKKAAAGQPAPDEPPARAPSRSDTGENTTADADEAAPLWKQFAGATEQSTPAGQQRAHPDRDAGDAPPEGDVPPSGDHGGSASTERARDARPRWQQFSVVNAPDESKAAPPPAAPSDRGEAPVPLQTLEEQVLGAGAGARRAQFVREIFNGSAAAYERALRRLHETDDWQAATRVIARDVFREHDVDIYSDAARSFTGAIEARFRQ